MGLFKRAGWHSGLTYQQTCSQCHTRVTYMDDKLDFRPWFADGFVYCPTCQKPLRHSERFALNAPKDADAEEGKETDFTAAFCSQCGYRFAETDRFCAQCGTKR